jgi:preprotein translocase subunit SecD
MRADRRPRGLQPLVAIAALGTLGVFAGCGDTTVVVQAPTTDVETSPETDAVSETDDAPETVPPAGAAGKSGGTLVLTLGVVGESTMSPDTAALAVARLEDRAAVLGYDAEATSTPDGRLQVTIHAVSETDRARIADEVASISGQVYLRPVLTDDQLNIPCVTSDPSDATTTTEAGTSSTLPDVPPDASGYVPARGGGFCLVGPAGGTGEVFSDDAEARIVGGSGWGVAVTLRPGPAGEDVWNTLASQCFNATSTCPTRQLAIELDGEVISAPTVQQPEFTGTVQIAGSFTEAEAENLADVLNRGALPVAVEIEATTYLPD